MRTFRYIRRTLVVALVAALAAMTYPGAVLVSMIVRLTPPPVGSSSEPNGALPWLHVEHPSNGLPYIADDLKRLVLLHGAIPQGLIDFWNGTDPTNATPAPFYPIDPAAYDGQCPANSPYMPTPPLCQEDIAKMAAFGFNSVRLPLSWSLLEPERGHFSKTYLDRIAQVVAWASSQDMYVILDMHQNAYSRYVGAPAEGIPHLRYYTGAPAWATLTDGFQSKGYLGQREVNPAVFEANSSFWYDRNGIQDEYIATVAFLAARFKGDSTVAGYSVFNEPWPGWNLPPGFEDLLLFPFYRRVIDAITGVHDGLPCWSGFFMPAACGYRDLGLRDQRHVIFLDAGLLREVTDFPTHLGMPISSYPNQVLSIHTYTHFYTIDHVLLNEAPDKANYPWGGYDQSYALAEREAKAINAALFVAEFGNPPSEDSLLLANQLRQPLAASGLERLFAYGAREASSARLPSCLRRSELDLPLRRKHRGLSLASPRKSRRPSHARVHTGRSHRRGDQLGQRDPDDRRARRRKPAGEHRAIRRRVFSRRVGGSAGADRLCMKPYPGH